VLVQQERTPHNLGKTVAVTIQKLQTTIMVTPKTVLQNLKREHKLRNQDKLIRKVNQELIAHHQGKLLRANQEHLLNHKEVVLPVQEVAATQDHNRLLQKERHLQATKQNHKVQQDQVLLVNQQLLAQLKDQDNETDNFNHIN
jgi:hypothetical protein